MNAKKSLLIAVWLAAAASFGVKNCNPKPFLEELAFSLPITTKNIPVNEYITEIEQFANNTNELDIKVVERKDRANAKGEYEIDLQISGELDDGTKYTLAVERDNFDFKRISGDIVYLNHHRWMDMNIETKEGTKIKCEVWRNTVDCVRLNNFIYRNRRESEESRNVWEFAENKYAAIKQDIRKKAPGLLKLAYKANLTDRTQNLDSLLN